ncbi:hydantoinase/oxoprolinase family protein [Fodinicurvata sp. EGI_FJ10296]|uniref:hydantoinase/oxoprolinase family protein n=1 Tax=Fodinicurvata sp. EGI_FJ10296 TaxID=3231908 RepID=UPI003454A70E
MGNVLVGIDVGGTFTDVVAIDRDRAEYHYFKLPSTRENPADAALEGLSRVLEIAGEPASSVKAFSHGTTVATNAILEGRYAPTQLVSTAGFRDILELARQRRPQLWNLDRPKPDPIAPRDRRFEVEERLDASGSVVTPLSAESLRRLVENLARSDGRTVAVCLLHSYANPAHEAAIAEAIKQALPDMYVCCSSDVVGEFREYERFCSTVLNAALLPVMGRYLGALEDGVRDQGAPAGVTVMQSNGGTMSAERARERPIGTFLSGPAAGVVGAIAVGRDVDTPDFVTFDMGGTSTDVCLVENGRAPIRRDQTVGGMPVRTPTVDIHTVGAGGGSIAWIDDGGLLKVGPKSAGARPGPACYGHGGTQPAVSDANVVLGRLNPVALLNGRMKVDLPAAHAALSNRIGDPLSLDAEQAAIGILQIVNANMVQAIRVISVERGYDPRDFALMAFGGAGPLHAAEIAEELGMRTVVVPARPGLLCAQGLLHSERRTDFSRTRIMPVTQATLADLRTLIEGIDEEMAAWSTSEALDREALTLRYAADMRYVGQDFELLIPFDRAAVSGGGIVDDLHASFHRFHHEHYGYAAEGKPVELVAVRLTAIAPATPLPAAAHAPADGDGRTGERPVWFKSTGVTATPVYDRSRLPAGTRLEGPALLEQMDSTTVVPPGMTARLAASGDIVMTRNDAASNGKDAQ